ncbi:hypothetical protein GW17_00034293 [Ensete ventricosum]|nr:hypothetical protein GW17_00034293 [Ensete ventricosum]
MVIHVTFLGYLQSCFYVPPFLRPRVASHTPGQFSTLEILFLLLIILRLISEISMNIMLLKSGSKEHRSRALLEDIQLELCLSLNQQIVPYQQKQMLLSELVNFVLAGVQRKLEMDNQVACTVLFYLNKGVCVNFRAGHLGRYPGKVTDVPSKAHVQMTDKLGRMSLNSRTHKTEKPPPSMKAGGWHSQSEIPARRYSRKVVG